MSTTAVAVPAPAPAATKVTKATKPKVEKKALTHPAYAQMIQSAVGSLNEKKGSSRAAILKYIVSNYKVGENVAKINSRLRAALKKGAESGLLKQTKGTGAAGSFSLGEKKISKAKKVLKKIVKKPVAKKTTGSASPKKAKTTKSKTTKKAATGKKAAKKATKPKAAKPAVKKATPKVKAPKA